MTTTDRRGSTGRMSAVLVRCACHLGAAGRAWRRRVAEGPRDRGDVPGWVLVTIMTAGLVVALWAIAGPKLERLFTNAIDSVQGP